MKAKLYLKSDCEFCKQIEMPEELNVEQINVQDSNYKGYFPENVPSLQLSEKVNVMGPMFINAVLNLLKDATNGIYTK